MANVTMMEWNETLVQTPKRFSRRTREFNLVKKGRIGEVLGRPLHGYQGGIGEARSLFALKSNCKDRNTGVASTVALVTAARMWL